MLSEMSEASIRYFGLKSVQSQSIVSPMFAKL